MRRQSSVALIVPAAGRAIRRANLQGAALETPTLDLLAARGTIERRWRADDLVHAALRPWQRGLLTALGFESPEHARYPYAATCAAPLPSSAEYWLTYELAHLVADMTQVSVGALESELALTEAEIQAFEAACASELTQAGWQVHGRLLGATDTRDCVLVNPETAAAASMHETMPSGRDAPGIRRLMTELQMTLHAHPLNARREQAGAPVVNAAWLWGGGRRPAVSDRSLSRCFGSDPYLRSLCHLHGQKCDDAPAAPTAIDFETNSIVVLSGISLTDLDRQWLAPLAQAVRKRRLHRLELVLDEWSLTATASGFAKFWRRPSPIVLS
jgi:hypothetical protein